MRRVHFKGASYPRIAFVLALAGGVDPNLCGDSQGRPGESYEAGPPRLALSVDTTLVEIPVTVVDSADRAVDNLTAQSFSLYEDGVEQTVVHFGSYDGPISACVLFDSSGSMAGKFNDSIEAVKEFLDFAVSGDEYCLVRFNNWPETVVGMTRDPARITTALSRMYPAGWTALLDGISVGVKEVKLGHNNRKVIVLISDGGDNRSLQTQRQIRRLVREAGAQIYSIGIFSTSDRSLIPGGTNGSKLLKIISGESGGRFFLIHGTDELPSAIQKIMLPVRRQYLLGYYPRSAHRDGKYRRIIVKVHPPNGTPKVHAYWRAGYYAPSE